MNPSKKAVVLILFNRPDLIEQVLDPVRKYAPHRLYLIADGPRADRAGERALCDKSRATAICAVDWPCEIIQIFSETNLGCRNRIISGLDEVFRREVDAIILEDDTVANEDFLPYCERMLNAHSDDSRIFSVTGTKLFSRWGQQRSAFLSNFTHIWGWATWRRSWLKYDRDLNCLGSTQFKIKMNAILTENHMRHWESVLNRVKIGEINTWDYQLQASAWIAGAYCITPPKNLVANRGFRSDATHTAKPGIFADMRTYRLNEKETTVLNTSRSYEWLFQNLFHNSARPLGWLKKCMARFVSKEKDPSQSRAPFAQHRAKESH